MLNITRSVVITTLCSIMFMQIEPIGCLHKADSSKFLVHCDEIAAGAEIVTLDSVGSIESVCIAVNSGEVLLLHSSPHEVSQLIN